MSLVSESFLLGLIGSGITGSFTPPMHERAADLLGIRLLYRPLDIDSLGPNHSAYTADECGELLERGFELGFNGFNITHPCKQLVMDHLDVVSDDALSLGAVNTVVLRDGVIHGYNTDHIGFRAGLESGLAGRPLGRVVQLGAGGAGAATAHALMTSGAEELLIFDPDQAKADEAVNRIVRAFPTGSVRKLAPEDVESQVLAAHGIVNATPIGMHHHPGSPIPTGLIGSHHWVADVIYLPMETPLIAAARAQGATVVPGGEMAVGQAVAAFELFTGQRPDATAMFDCFRELLARP